MQATAGEETILKASLVSGDAAPETIGPDVFGRGVALGSRRRKSRSRRKTASPTTGGTSDKAASETKRRGRPVSRSPTTPTTSSTTAGAPLRLEGGAYRRGWPGLGAFRGECWGCTRRGGRRASGGVRVRAGQRSFPSRWRTFGSRRRGRLRERAGAWFMGRFSGNAPSFSRGSRYSTEGADGSGSRGSRGRRGGCRLFLSAAATLGNGVFASMGAPNFARRGVKPVCGPPRPRRKPHRIAVRIADVGPQDGARQAQAAHDGAEVDAVRSVIGSIVSDLTDVTWISKRCLTTGCTRSTRWAAVQVEQTLGTGSHQAGRQRQRRWPTLPSPSPSATTFEVHADDPNANPSTWTTWLNRSCAEAGG